MADEKSPVIGTIYVPPPPKKPGFWGRVVDGVSTVLGKALFGGDR